MNNSHFNVLITGTTSGIGRELSKKYAKKSYNLILVSHSEEKLAKQRKEFESYGIDIVTIAKDLSEPNAAQEVFQELVDRKLHVDILVNNAGFGQYGHFINTNMRVEQDMIALNVTFLTQFTKLILQQMLKRRYGKILNVTSTAAYFPCPYTAVYSATKAYIMHFSRALRQELTGTGIKISVLCPGPTQTNFGKRSEISHSRLYHTILASAEDVASTALNGFIRGRRTIVPGVSNKMMIFFSKFIPQNCIDRCAKAFLQHV